MKSDARKFSIPFSEKMIVEKDEENEESNMPIYRHRQLQQDSRIKKQTKIDGQDNPP